MPWLLASSRLQYKHFIAFAKDCNSLCHLIDDKWKYQKLGFLDKSVTLNRLYCLYTAHHKSTETLIGAYLWNVDGFAPDMRGGDSPKIMMKQLMIEYLQT